MRNSSISNLKLFSLLFFVVFCGASRPTHAAEVRQKATPENLGSFELKAPELSEEEWIDYVRGVMAEIEVARSPEALDIGDLGDSRFSNSVETASERPTLEVELYQSSAAIGKQFILFRENGVLRYAFAVSAAARGRTTPSGTFRITKQLWRHMSGSYPSRGENNMDHASFFRPAYAFHATTFGAYRSLGTRASHGCVRMGRPEARVAYSLIKKHLPKVQFRSFASGDPAPSEMPTLREFLADDLNFIQDMLDSKNKGDSPFSQNDYFRYIRRELDNDYVTQSMRAKGIKKILEVDFAKDRVPE